MPNLNPPNPFDKCPKTRDAAILYLRRFISETAWSIGVTTDILQDYSRLGQDEMVAHSVRQIVAMVKVLREINWRLADLKREAAELEQQEAINDQEAVQRR